LDPRYTDRGEHFANLDEMHHAFIRNHNEYVRDNDVVINAGDFAFGRPDAVMEIINQLNGIQIFLFGSHDKPINKLAKKDLVEHRGHILEISVKNNIIIACHYCMRTWPKSHYNTWHVYGHSHGRLDPVGKSHDVGVDNNFFYPVSFEALSYIMDSREDNPNFLRKNYRRKS
jgi:calcineurin-like phosphoesterase family protein